VPWLEIKTTAAEGETRGRPPSKAPPIHLIVINNDRPPRLFSFARYHGGNGNENRLCQASRSTVGSGSSGGMSVAADLFAGPARNVKSSTSRRAIVAANFGSSVGPKFQPCERVPIRSTIWTWERIVALEQKRNPLAPFRFAGLVTAADLANQVTDPGPANRREPSAGSGVSEGKREDCVCTFSSDDVNVRANWKRPASTGPGRHRRPGCERDSIARSVRRPASPATTNPGFEAQPRGIGQ